MYYEFLYNSNFNVEVGKWIKVKVIFSMRRFTVYVDGKQIASIDLRKQTGRFPTKVGRNPTFKLVGIFRNIEVCPQDTKHSRQCFHHERNI